MYVCFFTILNIDFKIHTHMKLYNISIKKVYFCTLKPIPTRVLGSIAASEGHYILLL